MAMIEAGRDVLILKRASASRSSGKWNDDDFDVLANGVVVGRMFKGECRTRRVTLDVGIYFPAP